MPNYSRKKYVYSLLQKVVSVCIANFALHDYCEGVNSSLFHPFSIIREWHAAKMATASSAHFELQNAVQKPTGDITDTTSIFFFTVYGADLKS